MKGVSLKQNWIFTNFDLRILFPVVFLTFIGLYCILSKTYGSNDISTFYNYLNYVLLGFFLLFIVTFLPERIIYSFSIPFYFLSLVLLILVLFIGKEISGTKGWLQIAGLSMQPAEFAKLGLILFSAYILSIEGLTITNVRGFLILLSIFIVPITLLVLQPDFGTAIVILGILWGLLFFAGFNLNILLILLGIPLATLFYLKSIVGFVVVIVIFSLILYFINKPKLMTFIISVAIIVVISIPSRGIINYLPAHQQGRIKTFIDPTYQPTKTSYNVIQSVLAVGSGGLLGKGIFKGTQTQLGFVVAQTSDFAFSIPAEEFGFVGSFLIILAFVLLIQRVIQIGVLSKISFLRFIIFGYSFLLLIHFVENIGMVIGLFPVMGIPLPFISKGGSFLVVNFFFVGVVMNTYRRLQEK